MPIHDWTKVDTGIFHHFHQSWIAELAGRLNQGSLPADYYALAEQFAGGRGPDVLALQGPAPEAAYALEPTCGLLLADAPPRVRFRQKAEGDWYATKANAVLIRHVSGHRVVAIVEVVSPGNKSSHQSLRAFLDKAIEMLRAGVHLLVIDLFPPGSRDPEGIHKAIWDEIMDNDFALPQESRLTLAAYNADSFPEAFVEPVAVGRELPDMPLFLTPELYVPAPLEATYRSAWEKMPVFWRGVLQPERGDNAASVS